MTQPAHGRPDRSRHRRGLPSQNVCDAGLWEVDLFGRLRRTVDGRNEPVESAAEDLRDVQILVAAGVAAAWSETPVLERLTRQFAQMTHVILKQPDQLLAKIPVHNGPLQWT